MWWKGRLKWRILTIFKEYQPRLFYFAIMTILIKNILLIDGSGQPAVKADVLVKNEKIAAIGSFPRYQADTIIDGMGAYLAPGFIDCNTNSDRYLTIFSNPTQQDFLLQGITTIIGGQDGVSLAPLLYGSLDLQKIYTNPYKINVDWHTVSDFFDVVKRRPLGVNFGTFVGHSTLRHTIIGNDFRDLTPKELGVFRYMLDAAMKDGAMGVSFDLQSPVAALTPAKEIKLALEVVEKHKGIAAFKVRSGSDTTVHKGDTNNHFLPAVTEIINASKETGARVLITNFSPLNGLEEEYRHAIEVIEENAAVADVYFTMHPFAHSIIPIVSFLPVWAQRGGMDEILKVLQSPELSAKIISELEHFLGDSIVIHDAPGLDHLVGKTLRQFGDDCGTAMPETLLILMRTTKLRATLVYNNISLQEFNRALLCDRSLVASSGMSFERTRPQARLRLFSDTIATYLQTIVTDKAISIESAIRKLTSVPAQRLGIKQRGLIREGYFADLVMIRDLKIETVFVNVTIAVRDGALTETPLSGRIVNHANE